MLLVVINIGAKLIMKSEDDCEKWCRENKMAGSPNYDPCLMPNMPFGKTVVVKKIGYEGVIEILDDETGFNYSPYWFKTAKKINI